MTFSSSGQYLLEPLPVRGQDKAATVLYEKVVTGETL